MEKIGPTKNVDCIQIRVMGGSLADFPVRSFLSIRITALPVEAGEPSGNPVSGYLFVMGLKSHIERVGPTPLLEQGSFPERTARYRIEPPSFIDFEMIPAEDSGLLTINFSDQILQNCLEVRWGIPDDIQECSMASPDYSSRLDRCQTTVPVSILATAEAGSISLSDTGIVVY